MIVSWSRGVRSASGSQEAIPFGAESSALRGTQRTAVGSRARPHLVRFAVFGPVGIRSGGASDAYNAGVPVEMIMANGRWKSDCFRVYLHLRAGAVQEVFERALRGAADTSGERLAAAPEHHWRRVLRELLGDAVCAAHQGG